MLRVRSLISAAAAAIALYVLSAGCTMPTPGNAEIGCAYDPQSSPLCPGYDAGLRAVVDSGPPVVAEDDGASEGGGGASGLGMACTSSADCASFGSDYCLIAPNGGFASFCTYTHCTVNICGTSYGCCDCSQSPIALVNTYPPAICVPPALSSVLPSYGCTCLSTG